METLKRSTFKLLLYFKKNEPKKNGNVPVMGRITIDGTPKTFGTKLEIDPISWDLKHGRVLGKSSLALSTNQKLDKIRVRINKIYDDMLKDEGFATAQKVKLSFLGVGVMEDSLLKVFKKNNEDFEKMVAKGERSQSTYYKYKIVYNHLKEFITCRYYRDDMAFRELTCDFIREFDLFLRVDKGCTHNTVWVYTMPLYRVAEIAIKNGLIRRNPFEDYEISMKENDRSYLLKEQVETVLFQLVHSWRKQAHKQGTFSRRMVGVPRPPLWYQIHCILLNCISRTKGTLVGIGSPRGTLVYKFLVACFFGKAGV